MINGSSPGVARRIYQRVLHGKVQFLTLLKRLISSQGRGNGSQYQRGLEKGVRPIKCANLLHGDHLSGIESEINLKKFIADFTPLKEYSFYPHTGPNSLCAGVNTPDLRLVARV